MGPPPKEVGARAPCPTGETQNTPSDRTPGLLCRVFPDGLEDTVERNMDRFRSSSLKGTTNSLQVLKSSQENHLTISCRCLYLSEKNRPFETTDVLFGRLLDSIFIQQTEEATYRTLRSSLFSPTFRGNR